MLFQGVPSVLLSMVALITTYMKESDCNGNAIYSSYLDGCQQNQSRHSRQKYLRENYLFTCQCPKCAQQSGDPDVTSDEEMDSSEEEEDQDEQSD